MPLNILRRIVSGQKKRFQEGPDGFDLDLAYIAPRVIAMGLPAVHGKEVLYRNPMQETARFLQTYHRGHAKVYNLCSEHSYGAQHLSVALQSYPYDDHQTPPLAMIQHFCQDAAAWLMADPANVIAVHCKAGKGRTGIMICCLLLYLHKNAPDLANLAAAVAGSQPGLGPAGAPAVPAYQCAGGAESICAAGTVSNSDDSRSARHHAHELQQQFGSRLWHPWQHVPPVQLGQLEQPVQNILDLYAERRTHDGNGVSINSQRRYVGYFWAVLCSGPGPVGLLPQPRSLQLRQVTIRGLPPGTADTCVLLVEARPSGSLAPRASRVCARSAPRALSGNSTGLCIVPCTHAPQVQDDSSCSISTGPEGDTLTFSMPAASMGLSTLQQSGRTAVLSTEAGNAGPGAVQDACAANEDVPAGAKVSTAGLPHGWCSCCRATPGSCRVCAPSFEPLPGALPHSAAGSTLRMEAQTATCADGCAGTAPDESWDVSDEAGSCVVEGDARLVVLKGTTRLFYTWFNTAFLPISGCYSLTRAQLDRPAKILPLELSVTVRYVDMQPTAEDDDAAAASLQRVPEQQQHGKQRKQGASWLHGFQDPPLQTSGRAGKGPVQPRDAKGVKQLQVQAVSVLAEAAVCAGDNLVSTISQPSTANGCTSSSACTDTDTACKRQQQQGTRKGGDACCQSCAPVGSSSAPASPHGRKLRSSGSWRQHLPAISSISTSALLWGSGTASEGSSAQQRRSPKRDSWPGWDWEMLAAAEDEAGWTLGCGPAPAAASAVPPAVPCVGAQDATGAGRAKAVLGMEVHSQQHQGRSGINSSNRRRVVQEARSSRAVSGLVSSQPSIELPVIVKRPSGVNSLLDALLDPELSALSQTSNAAAAAAAAAVSGKVLASEASSSGVGGHSTAAGYKPPNQLRKGYSWHGNSWFAAAAGSTGGGKQGSSSSSSQAWPGVQQPGGQYVNPPQLAAVEASVLDLDPLLPERSGDVPGSVLSSCDPLQGLLEALNWSTDVERYQSPEHRSQRRRSLSASRRSTNSEPSSPRRTGAVLQTALLPSPQLQPTRSAPVSPGETRRLGRAVQSDSDVMAATPLVAGYRERSLGAATVPVQSGSAYQGSVSAANSGGSSSRRRSRFTGCYDVRIPGTQYEDRRADVCRLLDLENWAEDEAEGLDGGDAASELPAPDSSKGAASAAAQASGSHPWKGSASAAGLGKSWAVGLRRRSSDDAAADVDIPAPPPTPASSYPASDKVDAAAVARCPAHRRSSSWLGGSAVSSGSSRTAGNSGRQLRGARSAPAGDESLLGLLSAEGPVDLSCAAAAPPVLQQWQQLEKAWQKSWWV